MKRLTATERAIARLEEKKVEVMAQARVQVEAYEHAIKSLRAEAAARPSRSKKKNPPAALAEVRERPAS